MWLAFLFSYYISNIFFFDSETRGTCNKCSGTHCTFSYNIYGDCRQWA